MSQHVLYIEGNRLKVVPIGATTPENVPIYIVPDGVKYLLLDAMPAREEMMAYIEQLEAAPHGVGINADDHRDALAMARVAAEQTANDRKLEVAEVARIDAIRATEQEAAAKEET